jgi:hypothetical protein
MDKQTQEALKMAIGFASVISETYSTGGEAEKVINACKEALEQPTKSITEGATMFKQVGNSPKPSPPPPIHTCTYSRTINQEYPRKCVHCGKVEALEQPPPKVEPFDIWAGTKPQEDVPILFPRWDNGEPFEVRYPKQALEQPAQDTETMAVAIALQEQIRQLKEQPTVAELNNEYLRDTNVIGLEQPAWQGLTDDDMSIIFDKFDWKEIEIAGEHLDLFKFTRAIEQALKDKNK